MASDEDPPDISGLSCSFCGALRREVSHLVAAENVYICTGCLDLAQTVVAKGGTASNDRVQLAAVTCDFCGASPSVVRSLVHGSGTTICNECVDAARNIVRGMERGLSGKD